MAPFSHGWFLTTTTSALLPLGLLRRPPCTDLHIFRSPPLLPSSVLLWLACPYPSLPCSVAEVHRRFLTVDLLWSPALLFMHSQIQNSEAGGVRSLHASPYSDLCHVQIGSSISAMASSVPSLLASPISALCHVQIGSSVSAMFRSAPPFAAGGPAPLQLGGFALHASFSDPHGRWCSVFGLQFSLVEIYTAGVYSQIWPPISLHRSPSTSSSLEFFWIGIFASFLLGGLGCHLCFSFFWLFLFLFSSWLEFMEPVLSLYVNSVFNSDNEVAHCLSLLLRCFVVVKDSVDQISLMYESTHVLSYI